MKLMPRFWSITVCGSSARTYDCNETRLQPQGMLSQFVRNPLNNATEKVPHGFPRNHTLYITEFGAKHRIESSSRPPCT